MTVSDNFKPCFVFPYIYMHAIMHFLLKFCFLVEQKLATVDGNYEAYYNHKMHKNICMHAHIFKYTLYDTPASYHIHQL